MNNKTGIFPFLSGWPCFAMEMFWRVSKSEGNRCLQVFAFLPFRLIPKDPPASLLKKKKKAILLRRNAPEIPAARREARPVRSAHPHLSPRTGITRNGPRHDAQVQCAPRAGVSAPDQQPHNQYPPVLSRTAPHTPRATYAQRAAPNAALLRPTA